jgi:RNA recognition motif-containing protein
MQTRQQQMSSKSESNMTCKKLHIRGIKEEHTEEELRNYFGTYGAVEAVKVIRDQQTGQLKGFAFVNFEDYDPVDKAMR